jgi:hypothetical protein
MFNIADALVTTFIYQNQPLIMTCAFAGYDLQWKTKSYWR